MLATPDNDDRCELRQRALEELEAEILKGFASGPPVPITPEMWQQLRDSIANTDEETPT